MTDVRREQPLLLATLLGTVLQVAMVLAGHEMPRVALWFGPLGVAISMVAGLLYGRWSGRVGRGALGGGAVAGGLCALIGIAISFLLGDVTAAILLLGTLSSAVTGAAGGWLGSRLSRSRRVGEGDTRFS